jgi:NAD kinase
MISYGHAGFYQHFRKIKQAKFIIVKVLSTSLRKKNLAVKLDKKYAQHFLIMDKVVCEEGIIINGVCL